MPSDSRVLRSPREIVMTAALIFFKPSDTVYSGLSQFADSSPCIGTIPLKSLLGFSVMPME